MMTATEDIQIIISPDEFEAYLMFEDCETLKGLSESTIRQLLTDAGITTGIKEDVLANLREVRPGSRVLIAEGEKPVHGSDGYIEYNFNEVYSSEEKHFPIRNVFRGQIIATVRPPTEGAPGRTVRGRVIAQKRGKVVRLKTGMNTSIVNDNPLTVRADEDGHVVTKEGNTIEVHPVVTIRQNLDPKDGIVNCVGSLIVEGNVNSGVRINVNKDLTINGDVRDAVIHAFGNVVVKHGFIGQGDGVISAKGDITVHHIWNQTVIADGDVHILRESVGGTVRAGGRIVARDATVAGGLLEADKGVFIKNLGCGDNSQARVHVGNQSRVNEKLRKLARDIEKAERQFADVRNAIFKLAKMKIELGQLPVDKEGIMERLRAAKETLPRQIERMKEEQVELKKELESNYDARIEVSGTAHENVCIEVNGVRKIIEDDIHGVAFLERHGAIQIQGI